MKRIDKIRQMSSEELAKAYYDTRNLRWQGGWTKVTHWMPLPAPPKEVQ